MEKPPIGKKKSSAEKAQAPRQKFSTATTNEEILSTPRKSLKHPDDIQLQDMVVSQTPDDALPADLLQVKYDLMFEAEGKGADLQDADEEFRREAAKLSPAERERIMKSDPRMAEVFLAPTPKKAVRLFAMLRSVRSQINSFHGEHRKVAIILKETFKEELADYTLDEVEAMVREAFEEIESGGMTLSEGSSAEDFLRSRWAEKASDEE